jgi:hypothetical protein
VAYSGPFEVDEDSDELRHGVVVSLLPNWLGGTQIRHGHLDGEFLNLSASATGRDGITRTGTLVWKRAACHTTD